VSDVVVVMTCDSACCANAAVARNESNVTATSVITR